MQRTPRASWIIVLLIVSFVVITFALAWIVVWMKKEQFLTPVFALPILVLGSVMVLLIGLAGTAIIFNRLKLQDPRAAMGLPEGSIRAIIALMLIVIFAVISIFLVSTGGESSLHTVEGVTAAQANQYDPSVVVSRVLMSGSVTDPNALYKLTINVENKTADQMAQQLLTTLGTLVVAVASFYFGSQVVAAAQQHKPEDAGAAASESEPTTGPGPKATGTAAVPVKSAAPESSKYG
jgi:hypothetical protein